MIVAICGKTCSGKSTLEKALLKGGDFAPLISTTTRAPRPGEVNGREYHFESHERFERLISENAFIETNRVGGEFYGKTFGSLIAAQGRADHVVAVIEPVGMRNLRRYAQSRQIDFTSVWIEVSPQVQAQRFVERYADAHKDTMTQRLAMMLGEEGRWPALMQLGDVAWGSDLVVCANNATPEALAGFVRAFLT